MLLACVGMLTLLSTTKAQVLGRYLLCEGEWHYLEDSYKNRACFRAVTTPLPWQKAQEYCQQDVAVLLNVDRIAQLSYFVTLYKPLESLGEFLFDELGGEFWSGMYVRDGRLMWDARGPEYVIETSTKYSTEHFRIDSMVRSGPLFDWIGADCLENILEKRRHCSSRAMSSFSRMFSTRLSSKLLEVNGHSFNYELSICYELSEYALPKFDCTYEFEFSDKVEDKLRETEKGARVEDIVLQYLPSVYKQRALDFENSSFATSDKSWQWANGQPSTNVTEDLCGHVIQGKRTLMPSTSLPPLDGSGSEESSTRKTPESKRGTEVFSGAYSVKLSSCEMRLPFVCKRPIVEKVFGNMPFCPDTWFGNQNLPYCFRILENPLTPYDADEACRRVLGGEFFVAKPFTYNFTLAHFAQIYLQSGSIPVPSVWVDGGPVLNNGILQPGLCYAVKETYKKGFGIPVEVNCNATLPVICVKRTEQVAPAINIQVMSTYFNQTELETKDPFRLLSIRAKFNRQPNKNEIIFIHTPTRYINSSMGFEQKTRKNPGKLSFTYKMTYTSNQDNECEVSIWLPSYRPMEAPSRKRRHLSQLSTSQKHARNKLMTNSKGKLKVRKQDRNKHYHTEEYTDATVCSNKNGNDLIDFLTKFLKRKQIKKNIGKTNDREKKLEQYFKKKHHERNRKKSHRTGPLKHTTEYEKYNVYHHDKCRASWQYNLIDKSKGRNKRKDTLSNEYNENLREQKNRQHKKIYYKIRKGKSTEDRQSGGQHGRGKRQKRGISDLPDGTGGIRDSLVLNVDFDKLVWTTGYYSFGFYRVNSHSYTETEPVLIRFAEPDWFIYVVTVQMNPGHQIFSQTEGAAFNLYADERFVGRIGEYASRAMNGKPSFSVGNGDVITIRYYKAVPERIDGQVIKFRAFMSMLNSRSVSSTLEQSMVTVLEDHWKNQLSASDFLRDTVNVLSTVSCPKIQFDFDGTNITFPSVDAGETAFSWDRCISEKGAFSSRECQGGYDEGVRWGPVTFAEGCKAFPTLNTSDSSVDLQILSEVVLNATNLEHVLNDTIYLTLPNLTLTEADVIYTSEILHNLGQIADARDNILDEAFEVANNVLEQVPGIIEAAQKINNAANRIIKSIDEITNNVHLTGLKPLRVIKSFLATDIVDQDGEGSLVIGLKLDRDNANNTIDKNDLFNVVQPDDTEANVTDTAIYLDKELLKGRFTRVVFQIYTRTSLFTSVSSDRFEVISNVAAARLRIDGRTITHLGNNSVTAIFKTSRDDERTVCAYWDYHANEDAGGWRTDGCTRTILQDNRISCQCDHLTNFAVLIDLEAFKISYTDKMVLGIVTKVGLSFSMVGLGLTVLTFILFKHLRSGRGLQVLINLSVSMLCSSLIFLTAMDKTDNKLGCKLVAALLHYFILVSFAWMLVEGILQYLRFVKVLGTYIPNFMLKSMIPAWGIPVIPVVIVAAVNHDLYLGGNGYCWLERDAMLYGFIIPVAVILLANFGVFCLVLCSFFRQLSKGIKSNQSEGKMVFLHFQAAVSITVILGLTWVFGFFAMDGARVIFHYLFAIFNSFQGFLISLLFTARDKLVEKLTQNEPNSAGNNLSGSERERIGTERSGMIVYLIIFSTVLKSYPGSQCAYISTVSFQNAVTPACENDGVLPKCRNCSL